MKIKVLSAPKSRKRYAGPKAIGDIAPILSTNYSVVNDYVVNNIPKLWSAKRAIQIFRNMFSKKIIVVNHPLTQNALVRLLPKQRTIVLIHDLNGIRYPEAKNNDKEIENLDSFKYLIAHNQNMKDYLVEQSISSKKIYINKLFDYLCDDITSEKYRHDKTRVIYAGDLRKTTFINELEAKKMKFSLYLYGQNCPPIENKKVIYMDSFRPDQLPALWRDGGVGLVWDGAVDESDEDVGFKNYTRYNNPHKLSCYLAAGIPVIVWRKAAIAPLVEKENIGYTISSVYDINKIDFSDIATKQKNAERIGKKIRAGYYTNKVVGEIINDIEHEENSR